MTTQTLNESGVPRLVAMWESLFDPGRYSDETAITAGIEYGGSRAPKYSVSEASGWFFGMSPHWLRWLDRNGHLVLDGEPITGRDSQKDARSYNLNDIEKIAHCLYESGYINRRRFVLVLLMVQAQGMTFGLFSDPYEFDGVSYSLSVAEVAEMADRSEPWVRHHATSLGGVKRQWGDGRVRETWRFPEDGIDERIYETK